SPKDANVYGFKICNVPRVVCAAPSYLEQHGTPEHPHDLASHQGLFYQLQDTLHNVWHFSQGAGNFKVKMSGRHASNDADLVRRWCVAGKGIAAKSSLDMSRDLLAGNVVSVLDEYQCAPTELWLIFPSRQSITPAARLLRDLLKEKTAEVLDQLVKRGILAPSALD
ncbi:MAG TPA: LysR family transcriptional regulator, partial [Pseudomonas sp.]|nr:LysR family transcriptional regulator [Pseudomonas sp.]